MLIKACFPSVRAQLSRSIHLRRDEEQVAQ